jgi:hypothetical protein
MDEGILVLDNNDAPVPLGTGVSDPDKAQGGGDMKPPRPTEARMNIKINFRIEAVFCLLEQFTNAARLLDSDVIIKD